MQNYRPKRPSRQVDQPQLPPGAPHHGEPESVAAKLGRILASVPQVRTAANHKFTREAQRRAEALAKGGSRG